MSAAAEMNLGQLMRAAVQLLQEKHAGSPFHEAVAEWLEEQRDGIDRYDLLPSPRAVNVARALLKQEGGSP